MESMRKQTWLDRLLGRLRDTPTIGILILVFIIVVGVGTFTGALQSTWGVVQQVIGPSSKVRAEYCEFLRPLMVELDRTKAAFDRWNKKDLSLESETIREGNLRARALLREKARLVPDFLREDQKKLIFHYDRWLEEFDRVRVRQPHDSKPEFVFVYSFPQESAQHFRERMTELESQLGKGARCE